MTIAEQITAYRNEYDLTQENLARVLGISLSTLQNWECPNQQHEPSAMSRLALKPFFERLNKIDENDEYKKGGDV